MADRVTPSVRSRMMRSVRGANTKPELIVRKALHRAGLRYRLGGCDLPGTPDVVFRRFRTAIFVHGCFWHQHTCKKAARPKSNVNFWNHKLDANAQRDRRVLSALRLAGWKALVIWECQVNTHGLVSIPVKHTVDNWTLRALLASA